MSFEKLLEELEELETLGKSQSADDAADDDKIQAAADDGNPDTDGDGRNDVTGEDAGDDAGDVDDDEEEEEMGKSFAFKLDDGTEVEAVDGTKLVKSLMTRVEKSEGQMTKAMEMAVSLIKSQGETIKALQGDIAKIADSGRGRKAVVSIAEKRSTADLQKSHRADEEDGISATDFMAKALSAQAAGQITGVEVARAESYINRGLQVPEDIVKRVIQ